MNLILLIIAITGVALICVSKEIVEDFREDRKELK